MASFPVIRRRGMPEGGRMRQEDWPVAAGEGAPGGDRHAARRRPMGRASYENVQVASSLVDAMTSRSSFGPGTGPVEVKMSHWFFTWSAGKAVTAYISCMSWWSEARK